MSDYSRGYYAGSKHAWPSHKPPLPPDELVSGLIKATRELRDAVDSNLAVLSEDDPWQESLGKPVDAVDEALIKIGNWIKQP